MWTSVYAKLKENQLGLNKYLFVPNSKDIENEASSTEASKHAAGVGSESSNSSSVMRAEPLHKLKKIL